MVTDKARRRLSTATDREDSASRCWEAERMSDKGQVLVVCDDRTIEASQGIGSSSLRLNTPAAGGARGGGVRLE